MIIKAPAKINLYLEIINKREDGYHNLESIMHTVSLCDTLEFELSDNIELFCSDKDLPTDKTNLVYKTVAKLKKKYNIKKRSFHVPFIYNCKIKTKKSAKLLINCYFVYKNKRIAPKTLMPFW